MQKELKVFESLEFGQVRTMEVEGSIYFVANDVAKSLGYKNPSNATNTHCKKAIMAWGSDSLGRRQEFKLIPEGDIYRLISKSQLPAAEKFESWVFDDVLPSIRKTGSYNYDGISTELKAIIMQDKKIQEVQEEINAVNNDLQSFKQDMPILGIEETKITGAVRKKGVGCLGGKHTEAYRDNSLRSKIYSDIYGQLKREFGVGSYKAIKRSQCDIAINIIENYEAPHVLAEQINDTNAQMYLA